jgi:hypothetical protein
MTGRRRGDLGWWSGWSCSAAALPVTCGPVRGGSSRCPRHTPFHAFGVAIDDAFARWDRSHLRDFTLPRLGKRVTEHRYIDDFDPVKNWTPTR